MWHLYLYMNLYMNVIMGVTYRQLIMSIRYEDVLISTIKDSIKYDQALSKPFLNASDITQSHYNILLSSPQGQACS